MFRFQQLSRLSIAAAVVVLVSCSGSETTRSSTSATQMPTKDMEGAKHSPTVPSDASAAPTTSSPMTAAPAGSSAPARPDAGSTPASDAGDPADAPVEPGQLCERLSTVQCTGETRCCNTPRSASACKAARMMDCMSTNLDEVARLPISGFNQEKAAILLRKLEQLVSSCDPSVKPWSVSPDGLRSIFEGSVAADQPCTPAPGVASVANYGGALASCKDPATHACLFTGAGPPAAPATATCAARASAGAKCFVDTNCREELYCDNTSMTYSGGTCTARKPLGDACLHSFECASGFCNHTGSVCGPPDVQHAYCN
jgi:hypothetical protein